MRVSVRICFGYLMILLFIGCTPSLKLNRLKPAEINLSSYKKIAIGEINGQGGSEIGDLLTQALFNAQRFDVIDREHLNTIMKEQNMTMTESFDPASSVRLGKMMGSSALIFGKVQRRTYDQKNSVSKGTCKDKNGNEYTCYTHTVEGYWNLNTSFKVVDVSTGRILATCANPYSASKSNWERDSRPKANWDVDEVFTELAKNSVNDFMKKIAPYTVPVEVKIYEDNDLPELATGITYAQQGDWNSAIEQFKSACNRADNDPKIKSKLRARAHYNLGIAYGYSGKDYDQAITELQKAVSINPEDAFYKEQGRIKGFKEDDEQLKRQGVDVKSSQIVKLIPIS